MFNNFVILAGMVSRVLSKIVAFKPDTAAILRMLLLLWNFVHGI
jgi:hypothetical protein